MCLEGFRKPLAKGGLCPETVDIGCRARRLSTGQTYETRLGKYYEWCGDNVANLVKANLTSVTIFLDPCSMGGLQVSTVKTLPLSYCGYIHGGFDNGTSVSNNDIIASLIKDMFHTRPAVKRLALAWSINKVLVWLAKLSAL